jgi:hypothetical protein
MLTAFDSTKLSADKKQQLSLFLRLVDNVRNLGMINKRLEPVSVTLHMSSDGISSQIKNLNIDELRSVLAGLRQFYLQSDPTNFKKICNILNQINLDANTLSWVRAAWSNWKRTLDDCPSHYWDNSKPLTVEDSFELYFYAVMFHADNPQLINRWDSFDDYEKNIVLYSIRAALPPLFWSISTVDTVIDTILNHPERDLPEFPASTP